jgi:biopolymer transport protein ExbD
MNAAVWKMRHAGSPQSRDGLTDVEILEGLTEGDWEPDDEVQGPGEADWQPLEAHPHFAEALAEYEPPARHSGEDEARLDFNPLIDVALVLLIFFMLTTAYSLFAKVLDLPQTPPPADAAGPKPPSELAKKMIIVSAKKRPAGTVLTIDGQEVTATDVAARLKEAVSKSGKNLVLLDAADDVEWEGVTAVMDAATGAGVERVVFANKVPPKAPAPPPPGG